MTLQVFSALALAAVLVFLPPVGTAPIGAQPVPANNKYYLAEVKVYEWYSPYPTTAVGPGAPKQVLKTNPGTIKFSDPHPKYTLNGSLEVSVPPVLEVGKTFNVSFLAGGDWKLQDADGRLQITRMGFWYPPNQRDENLENAPAGEHTLKMDKPSQPVLDSNAMSNCNPTTKDGVTTFSFNLGARFNTQGHGDSFLVRVDYTYANDPKLAGNAGSSGTGPTTHCPPNIGGDWVGPISGTFSYKVNGTSVTGTVANLGGKYGAATITGTLVGTGMTGTWKSATGSGTITVTGPDASCTTWMTYTTDTTVAPPRPGTDGSGTEKCPYSGSSTSGGGPGNPWDTPEGRNCFEQWIALATRMVNAADLGADRNARKPWGFNKYGMFVGGTPAGTTSTSAPDGFAAHGNNKYWWMWDYYDTDSTGGVWVGTGPDGFGSDGGALKKAGVPTLRDYVRRCAPGSTPNSTNEPPLGDDMILYADNVVVPKGSQVPVAVRIKNARDVLNLDFTLTYRTDIVSAAAAPTQGSVVSNIWESNLKQPGLYKFNFAQLTRFNADAEGRTPLTLGVWTVNDSKGTKLPIRTIPGSITVYDPNNTTNPWNPKNPNPPGTPTEPTCSGTGRQTLNDAQCCLKMWVELIPENKIMDLDQSGTVDSRDAVIVMQNVAARSLNP